MISLLEAPARCRCGKELLSGEKAWVYGEQVYGECCHAVPLDGNLWQEALKVAQHFRYKADPEDRDDLVQDIVLRCAEVAKRKELTEASLWVIARYVVFHYWRDRAKKPLSLSTPLPDTEGIELWETLEDKGADLDAWLEARLRLGELPTGILRIAKKLERGDPLTRGQRACLNRFRQDGKQHRSTTRNLRRYRKRRARGLCPTCGKQSDGFVYCGQCRETSRTTYSQHRNRLLGRQRERLARQTTLRAREGRCRVCGKPAESGRCPRCLVRHREHMRRWRKQSRGDIEAAQTSRMAQG